MWTKAIEKEVTILEIKMAIGPRSEAWSTLTKTAVEKQEVVYNRAKSKFESLEIRVTETVADNFARVHIVLTSLTRHKVNTSTHEIKRTVLRGLTSRLPDEIPLYTMKGDFDLKDLEPDVD